MISGRFTVAAGQSESGDRWRTIHACIAADGRNSFALDECSRCEYCCTDCGELIGSVIGEGESAVVDRPRKSGRRYFGRKINHGRNTETKYRSHVLQIRGVAEPQGGVWNSDHRRLFNGNVQEVEAAIRRRPVLQVLATANTPEAIGDARNDIDMLQAVDFDPVHASLLATSSAASVLISSIFSATASDAGSRAVRPSNCSI